MTALPPYLADPDKRVQALLVLAHWAREMPPGDYHAIAAGILTAYGDDLNGSLADLAERLERADRLDNDQPPAGSRWMTDEADGYRTTARAAAHCLTTTNTTRARLAS